MTRINNIGEIQIYVQFSEKTSVRPDLVILLQTNFARVENDILLTNLKSSFKK